MRTLILKVLKWVGVLLVVIVLGLLGFLWFGTYHPAPVETMTVHCPDSAPTGRPDKISKF